MPLTRPPNHHMVCQVTGGLESLCKKISSEKLASDKTEAPINNKTEDQLELEKENVTLISLSKYYLDLSNDNKVSDVDSENQNSPSSPKEKSAVNGEKDSEEKDSTTKNGEKVVEDTKNSTENQMSGVDENEEGPETKEDEKEEANEEEDDEEEDVEEEEEEDETTEYTDEDGEFVPLSGMPLLAGRFKYIKVFGRGQSALIIKAEDTFNNNNVIAIKVLHKVYKPIGSQEADILLELHRADPYNHVPFIRVKTQFMYGPHYCLVFDALSPTSLYTHYELKDVRGISSLHYIRHLAVKLLTVMGFLNKQNVIHADLKPENILLANEDDLNTAIVVDFGNALRNTEEELSLYYSDFELQTLLYRAPEVIFGLRFGLEVDMWSLGCLLAECYIGKPLFMGKTKTDILSKVSKLLGPFPPEFSMGECSDEFKQFLGPPLSRYQRVQNLTRRLSKCTDITFITLIERLLTYSPKQRLVPSEASCHPFIAYLSPHLYFTPTPGPTKYPTILVDEATYPLKPSNSDVSDDHKKHLSKLQSLSSVINKSNEASNVSEKTDTKTVEKKETGNHSTARTSRDTPTPPASRSDVKETLKSMGLRCEDFTISVYSKEQAHAILKKQGLEVMNNRKAGERGESEMMNNRKRGDKRANTHGNRSSSSIPSRQQPPPPAAPPTDDDDDDDCVILEPPVSKRPPQPRQMMPQYPKQFQLMGTTVQVNRGTKRPHYGNQNYGSNKRINRGHTNHHYPSHHPYYSHRRDGRYARQQQYMEDYSDESDPGETSVQDTLNRLKNYNISITCRRNEAKRRSEAHGSGGSRGPHRMMGNKQQQRHVMHVNNVATDSDDYEDEAHFDSEEEEEEDINADMAKFLECQIGDDSANQHKNKRQKNRRAEEEKDKNREEGELNESLDSSGIEILERDDEKKRDNITSDTEEGSNKDKNITTDKRKNKKENQPLGENEGEDNEKDVTKKDVTKKTEDNQDKSEEDRISNSEEKGEEKVTSTVENEEVMETEEHDEKLMKEQDTDEAMDTEENESILNEKSASLKDKENKSPQDGEDLKEKDNDEDLLKEVEDNEDLLKGEEDNEDLLKGEEENEDLLKGEEENEDLLKGDEENEDLLKGDEDNEDLLKEEEGDGDLLKGEEDILKEDNEDLLREKDNEDLLKGEDVLKGEEDNEDVLKGEEDNEDVLKGEDNEDSLREKDNLKGKDQENATKVDKEELLKGDEESMRDEFIDEELERELLGEDE